MFAQTSRTLATGVRRFSSQASSAPVICAPVRTAIGSFNGALAQFSAPQLGSAVISASCAKAGLDPKKVNEVFMGNVVSANIGQAPARQAALGAKLGLGTPCTTVNKVCSSGLKAVMFASQSISLGQQDVIVAGGMESMSNAPFYMSKSRTGRGLVHTEVIDGLMKDGLWDAHDDHSMGVCGEHAAETQGFSREDQDNYAIESYKRAQKAAKEGWFKDEIIPMQIKVRKNPNPVDFVEDEEPSKPDFSKIPKLRSAFKKDGSVTAANSSTISDGASAMIVTSEAYAKANNLKPIARILGYGDAARAPLEFPIAPADAVPVALKNAGVSINDVDYWEISEAFAVVPLSNMKILNLDHAKVNACGGAVSIGHPIGASGARILTTLAHTLQREKGKIGVAAICNGGGGASAMVIEAL